MSFREQFSRFPLWNVLAWAAWALAFAVLEFMGVFNRRYATLTYLSLHTIPRWALAMIMGWLVYHFIVQYGARLD